MLCSSRKSSCRRSGNPYYIARCIHCGVQYIAMAQLALSKRKEAVTVGNHAAAEAVIRITSLDVSIAECNSNGSASLSKREEAVTMGCPIRYCMRNSLGISLLRRQENGAHSHCYHQTVFASSCHIFSHHCRK